MSTYPTFQGPAERIDTHLHLLYPDRFDYSWTDGYPKLNGAFEIEDYRAEAESCGIAGALFMEVDVDAGQAADEARYFYEMTRSTNSFLWGVIASARPEDEDFERDLDLLADSALRGIRRVLHTQPDTLSTSSLFRSNVSILASRGLTFDLCVQQRQLPLAVELVDACPNTSFILDHCGSPDIAGNGLENWAEALRSLALRPNVACKISGLPSYCAPGLVTKDVLKPYIEIVTEAFGWDRVTWGGDWPVCRHNSSLGEWCAVLDEVLSGE
ncbi:MAG: amidohydrolase family protein, partial [Candidatus Eremiobacteraeota bacterium]|nr:amidohydrolase family protein [Candidatus Eremiobacteraeota bacterium]